MTDTYEGWSNRETWCANLWLANDEGTYTMVREWAEEAVDTAEAGEYITAQQFAIQTLASQLKDWFEELEYGDGEDDYVPSSSAHAMLRDIGSLYRVDWCEVAGGWVTDATEELARGGGR